MTEKPEHRISKDGSSTLYSSSYNQYYHNPNGSVSESKHIFFEGSGIIDALAQNRNFDILEIGFGTGLNLFLLFDYYISLKSHSKIRFFSVEAHPVSVRQANKFNYHTFSPHLELDSVLSIIFKNLKKGLNIVKPIKSLNIELHLFNGFFAEFEPNVQADFVFHDPFSPEVNEELWTPEVFKKIKANSSDNSVLTTYCAASKARAAMAKAGWKLARAQGALGKREMTIASLNEENLSSFKRINEDRLIQRLNNGEFD